VNRPHNILLSTRLWQALLVMVLLWAQVSSAQHLHLLDIDNSGDEQVTECLSCQQLGNDDSLVSSNAIRWQANTTQTPSTRSPRAYYKPQQTLFAIRAPPAQL